MPGMPLLDVAGKVNVDPEHTGAIAVKVGVTGVFTVIVIVVVNAHWPVAGVKV